MLERIKIINNNLKMYFLHIARKYGIPGGCSTKLILKTEVAKKKVATCEKYSRYFLLRFFTIFLLLPLASLPAAGLRQ